MNKLLASIMTILMLTIGLSAQPVQDYEQAFKELRESSMLVQFRAVYVTEIKDEKTKKIRTMAEIYHFTGSGTIVGKRTGTNGWHTYYVLTCRHVLVPRKDQLGNPVDDLEKAKSVNVVVVRFTPEGVEDATAYLASGFWIIPVTNIKLDVAVVQFETSDDLPVAQIHPNLPRDIFGKTGLCVSSVGGLANIPSIVRLGVNKPAHSSVPFEFNFSGPTRGGMSGCGVFVLYKGKWVLAGVINAQYGNGGPFGFGIRIDAIVSAFKIDKKSYFLEKN